MEKITRVRLEGIVKNINREAMPQNGKEYMIEYAYGQPVLVLNDTKTLCGRSISPRLSKGQLAVWLWAFLDGISEYKRNTKQEMTYAHNEPSKGV